MHEIVRRYIAKWRKQGYPIDIPDEVPDQLMAENLAPSYKQIAIAILKHDPQSIGFQPKTSIWYTALKHLEISRRKP